MIFARPHHQRIAKVLKAINAQLLKERDGLLERCMVAMDMSVPKALLWQNISKLQIP